MIGVDFTNGSKCVGSLTVPSEVSLFVGFDGCPNSGSKNLVDFSSSSGGILFLFRNSSFLGNETEAE